MTCNSPIFVDDEGTIFRVTVQECIGSVETPVDVSGQTAMSIIFQKPSHAILSRTPVFTTDGTDGQVQYVIQTGELDEDGIWALQAEVTLPGGTFRTSISTFEVQSKLA